jgi:tetratricopeptide (TPR) repeat protein
MWPRSPTISLIALLAISFLLSSCAPKFVPKDLAILKTPEELGLASQRAFQNNRKAIDKKEKSKWSWAGVLYSNKCLEIDPDKTICLYYNAINRGAYIKNHIINYQSALKAMVRNCKKVARLDPKFQQGGCYRVLGEIYAKAPSFSLNPQNITRDLDKSAEYLQEAVNLAPDYPLNRLFLARTLQALGEDEKAAQQLKEFDQLEGTNLDKEYPEWKKERENLAKKLNNL